MLVKTKFRQFEVAGAGKDGKSSKPVKFSYEAPHSYHMGELRALLLNAVKPLVAGEQKEVELRLERWPQVQSAMGELKHRFEGMVLVGSYTTDDEENVLFRIKREITHRI